MLEQLITHRLYIEGVLFLILVLLLMGVAYRLQLSERRRNIRYEIESISFQLDTAGIDVRPKTFNPTSNLNKAITEQFRDENRQFIIFCSLIVLLFFLLFSVAERC
jgi:hypothetical protein